MIRASYTMRHSWRQLGTRLESYTACTTRRLYRVNPVGTHSTLTMFGSTGWRSSVRPRTTIDPLPSFFTYTPPTMSMSHGNDASRSSIRWSRTPMSASMVM